MYTYCMTVSPDNNVRKISSIRERMEEAAEKAAARERIMTLLSYRGMSPEEILIRMEEACGES